MNKLEYDVQLIIDKLIQACAVNISIDVTSTHDRESSMLDWLKVGQPLAERFDRETKAKYQARFNKLGDVDGVLKDLEEYILKQKLHTQNPSLPNIYDTALRALSDPNTISWQSLLHKGANNNTYHGYNLREMLAYYWLAASDKHTGTRGSL